MKTLICVDLQKEFESAFRYWSWDTFPGFLHTYDKIFTIYDHTLGDPRPYDVIKAYTTLSFNKKYDSTFDVVYSNFFGIFINNEFEYDIEKKNSYIENMKNGTPFVVCNCTNNSVMTVLKVNSEHKITEINGELVALAALLPSQVDICGGAYGECLTDVIEILKFFRKSTNVISEWTY